MKKALKYLLLVIVGLGIILSAINFYSVDKVEAASARGEEAYDTDTGDCDNDDGVC